MNKTYVEIVYCDFKDNGLIPQEDFIKKVNTKLHSLWVRDVLHEDRNVKDIKFSDGPMGRIAYIIIEEV